MSEYLNVELSGENMLFRILDKPIIEEKKSINKLVCSGERGIIYDRFVYRLYTGHKNEIFKLVEIAVFDGERYIADRGGRAFNPSGISNYITSEIYAVRDYEAEIISQLLLCYEGEKG